MKSAFDIFYENQSPANALKLAIEDAKAGKLKDWPFIDALNKALAIVEAQDNAMSAAAPDMLAALEKLAGHCGHYASMPHAHSDAWKDVAEAHAAIKKAKGGTL